MPKCDKNRSFGNEIFTKPGYQDFCSGKIKCLAYVIFEGGETGYFWSCDERHAEIEESVLALLDRISDRKIMKIAIFKLHKVFDRSGNND